MLNLPKKVFLREVGPRDGFQMEKKFIPTDLKVKAIDMLSQCSFQEIQFTSFVHPRAVPNMADAEEVIDKIKYSSGTKYDTLIPNCKGYIRAAAAGIKKVELTLSSTDSHNINNLNCTTGESIAGLEECLKLDLIPEIVVGLAVVFGCPFEGRPPFEKVKSLVDAITGLGVREMVIADSSGVADPGQVYDYLSRLKDAHPDILFYFHAHNTHGTALANVLAALQAGITAFDSSVAGLGGCPYIPGASGNLATEDLVQFFEIMGIETGINLEKLIEAAKFTAEAVGHHDSNTLRVGKLTQISECGPKHQQNG